MENSLTDDDKKLKRRASQRRWREDNREKTRQQQKDWRQRNPEYYQNNRERILEGCRRRYQSNPEKDRERVRKWQKANPDKRASYKRTRYCNDIDFRLSECIRNRVRSAIYGDYKSGSAIRDLACTIPEFRSYIQSKFTDGMSWENYGDWHLDHVRPLSSFDLADPQQFEEAVHYSNYQPLWADDNFRKGSRYSL